MEGRLVYVFVVVVCRVFISSGAMFRIVAKSDDQLKTSARVFFFFFSSSSIFGKKIMLHSLIFSKLVALRILASVGLYFYIFQIFNIAIQRIIYYCQLSLKTMEIYQSSRSGSNENKKYIACIYFTSKLEKISTFK